MGTHYEPCQQPGWLRDRLSSRADLPPNQQAVLLNELGHHDQVVGLFAAYRPEDDSEFGDVATEAIRALRNSLGRAEIRHLARMLLPLAQNNARLAAEVGLAGQVTGHRNLIDGVVVVLSTDPMAAAHARMSFLIDDPVDVDDQQAYEILRDAEAAAKLESGGQPIVAEPLRKKVACMKPCVPSALLPWARCLALCGRFEETLSVLDDISKIAPDNPSANVQRAIVLRSLERHAEADDLLESAFHAAPWHVGVAQHLIRAERRKHGLLRSIQLLRLHIRASLPLTELVGKAAVTAQLMSKR